MQPIVVVVVVNCVLNATLHAATWSLLPLSNFPKTIVSKDVSMRA